mgnify:CR=1 FL=1
MVETETTAMSQTGCTYETARDALSGCNDDVIDVILRVSETGDVNSAQTA